MRNTVYLNECCASEDDLSPLVGCTLTDISGGVDEDGTEFATLEFFNPVTKMFIRMSISENSELSISDFENQ